MTRNSSATVPAGVAREATSAATRVGEHWVGDGVHKCSAASVIVPIFHKARVGALTALQVLM